MLFDLLPHFHSVDSVDSVDDGTEDIPKNTTSAMKFDLRQLSRVVVRFRPQDRSAREFLSRVVCQSGTNPDCKIEHSLTVDDGVRPSVEVELDTKEVFRLETDGLTVGDIVRFVSNKSREREVTETFERAGWKKDAGGATVCGERGRGYGGMWARIPRR